MINVARGYYLQFKQNGISDKLLSVLSGFLKDRKQKVTLNGQVSSWTGVNVGVPQGSILGSLLLFLVYINDLADGLSSNVKLFADDTSLLSVIHDVDTCSNELNNDLYQINKWAFQWKMSFNPEHCLAIPISKHFGIFLDVQLTFEGHLKVTATKVNKTIGLILKLQNVLPRPALMTIEKTFVRPHLVYD